MSCVLSLGRSVDVQHHARCLDKVIVLGYAVDKEMHRTLPWEPVETSTRASVQAIPFMAVKRGLLALEKEGNENVF
ncbi:hypothetical protein ACHAWF_002517 [Thalassiosira exigua]